jgi:hypothetical protein
MRARESDGRPSPLARRAAGALGRAGLFLCALAALTVRARAVDSAQFWPELSLFQNLGPQTRLYLDAAYARDRESDGRSLELAGYLDVTLQPFLRGPLRGEDWRKNKYFWLRLGYDHLFKTEGGEKQTGEDRVILSAYPRAYLPEEIMLEGRLRADLRWIGGDYSTRYRLRLEVNREFTVHGQAFTPYLQAEVFYDTRYDGWSRDYFQLGAELPLTEHFRVEPYLALQLDRLPRQSSLGAVGLVAKWYY